MHFFSKLIKPLLALALAGAALSLQACSKEAASAQPPAAAAAPRTVAITVTENGYEPASIPLKKDEPVKLVVTRTTEQTCATDIIIKDYDIEVKLPLNQPVEVAFTPTKSGKLVYGCAMGQMVQGVFLVD